MDVLADLRALHLALGARVLVTQLADELRLVVPRLHVRLGQHAARGIAGDLTADFDAAALDERAALAGLAEAEAFEVVEEERRDSAEHDHPQVHAPHGRVQRVEPSEQRHVARRRGERERPQQVDY